MHPNNLQKKVANALFGITSQEMSYLFYLMRKKRKQRVSTSEFKVGTMQIPFTHKFTNIDFDDIDNAGLSLDDAHKEGRNSCRKTKTSCICASSSKSCLEVNALLYDGAVTCKNAKAVSEKYSQGKRSKIIRPVKECYVSSCAYGSDEVNCGNRFFGATRYSCFCVPAIQYRTRDGVDIYGLVVMTGFSIPEWGVIDEYTGDIRHTNEKTSCYSMHLDKSHVIDALERGNNMRYINHSCGDVANTISVVVEYFGQLTVFIRATRKIRGGEFLAFDYGPQKRKFFEGRCLCMNCNRKST